MDNIRHHPIHILENAKREIEELLNSINHAIEHNENNDAILKDGIDIEETEGWINHFNRMIQELDRTVELLEHYKDSVKR